MAEIAWFHDPYDGTGAGYRQRVYNIVDRLDDRHDIRIYGRERGQLETWMKYNLTGGTIPFELAETLWKRRILKKELERADTIIVYRWFAGRFDTHLVNMLADSDTRFVYDIDENYWGQHEEYTKNYITSADAVVAGSDVLYNSVSELNDAATKITTVVDTDDFAFKEASNDTPTITWVDRFLKVPDVCRTVRDALVALQDDYDFEFRLVGAENEKIRNLFDDVENAQIQGLVHPDAVPDILQDSDIGLLPLELGEFEAAKGGPTMLFEYMAAGAVPVSTAIGDPTSVIDHGTNGFLVEENKEWEAVLREALESDLASISRAAREDAETKYSVEVAAETYEDVLTGGGS